MDNAPAPPVAETLNDGANTAPRLPLATFDRIDWTCTAIDVYAHNLDYWLSPSGARWSVTTRRASLRRNRREIARAYARYQQYVTKWPEWEGRRNTGGAPFRHECRQYLATASEHPHACGVRHFEQPLSVLLRQEGGAR